MGLRCWLCHFVRFGVRRKRKNKLDLYSKALPQIQDLGTHGRAKVKRNHGKSNRIYPHKPNLQ